MYVHLSRTVGEPKMAFGFRAITLGGRLSATCRETHEDEHHSSSIKIRRYLVANSERHLEFTSYVDICARSRLCQERRQLLQPIPEEPSVSVRMWKSSEKKLTVQHYGMLNLITTMSRGASQSMDGKCICIHQAGRTTIFETNRGLCRLG